ncbi:hypothetical protein DB30_04747 [Enhygromyxa salina]|uniref:Uncharacterized protein n=1 Tax=Enhygromyxa salina TaxID=215803 RepID=A0A0C2D8J7_9BACT|nr:hypothetical protein DB30_04747 [Enhygromyxa salina]
MGPNFGTVSDLRAGDPAAIASSESSMRPKPITTQVMSDAPRPAGLADPSRVRPTLLLSARSREMSTP